MSSSPEVGIDLVLVPDELDARWGVIWPLIQLALPPGFLDERAVYAKARAAEWDLWTVSAGGELLVVVTTELVHFPLAAVLRVLNCGGRGLTPERARAVIDRLEHFGRSMGASRCEIVGRRGWARIFPEYRERARIFSKEIR